MGFTKQRFGLFYSLPLDALDWQNLTVSKVKLVLLMLEFADAPTLLRLKGMGVRVLLRVNEDTIYNDEAPDRILSSVLRAMQSCPIDGVIVGNEPDAAQSFEYGAATWGQDFCYMVRKRFDAVRRKLQGVGIKVISPALIMRSISEDDPPVPGRVAWREILTLPDNGAGFQDADYNGCHLYAYGWDGYVDEMRFKFALKHQAELWHKGLIIDEVGISGSHTPLEKMRGYIDIAEILLAHKAVGSRVEALIPFISNGVPGAWDAKYLLRDPSCYVELGAWMSK